MSSEEEGLFELCGLDTEDFGQDASQRDLTKAARPPPPAAQPAPVARAAPTRAPSAPAEEAPAAAAAAVAAAAAAPGSLPSRDSLPSDVPSDDSLRRDDCSDSLPSDDSLRRDVAANSATCLAQLGADELGVLRGGGADPAACARAIDELAAWCEGGGDAAADEAKGGAVPRGLLLPALQLLQRAAGGARGRLLLRVRGALPHLLALMVPPPSAAAGAVAPLAWRLAAASVLRECARDDDCAYDMGVCGGHLLLLNALETGAEPSAAGAAGAAGVTGAADAAAAVAALADAAAEVVARCAARPSGGFPMRAKAALKTAARGALALRRPCRAVPRAYSFDGAAQQQQQQQGEQLQALRHALLLRSVPQRQEAQATVGFLLWGSATVLCNWLCRQPRGCWRGKRVLEIGAGLGLCGLLAAQRCEPRELIMTDYQRDIIANLEHNAALNFGGDGAPPADAAADADADADADAVPPPVVRKFDWDDIDAHPWAAERFDVVIGSDLICEEANGRGVTRSLRKLLKPGTGVAYVVNPSAHSRWSIDYFKQQLRDAAAADAGGDGASVPLRTDVRALAADDALLDGVFDRRDVAYEFYHIHST